LAIGSNASAASFSINDSVQLSGGPFGTVTLTDISGGGVQVDVSLTSGFKFVQTGSSAPGNHPGFAFNLNPGIAIGSGNITYNVGNNGAWAFYDTHTSPVAMSDNFGTYMYAFYCTSCNNGGSNPNPGPLKFSLTISSLTAANFIANNAGTYFAVDLTNAAGGTGLARSTGGGGENPPVPEPATLGLMGLGLGAAAWMRRRATNN
jgi:hypothetical protein